MLLSHWHPGVFVLENLLELATDKQAANSNLESHKAKRERQLENCIVSLSSLRTFLDCYHF